MRRTAPTAVLAAAGLALAAAPAGAAPYDGPTEARPFAAVTAENAPNPTSREAVLDLAGTTPDAGVPRCLGDASFAHTAWAWIPPDERPRRISVSATPQATTGPVTTATPDLALFVQPLGGTPQSADVREPAACDGREILGDGRADANPQVDAVLPAGRPALVQVGWRAGDPLAPVVATLADERIDRLAAPAGDDPDAAPLLDGPGAFEVPLGGATLGAGDPAQPACPAPATVWRQVRVPAGGPWTVSGDGDASTVTVFGDPLAGDSALACADGGDGGPLAATVALSRPGRLWVRLGTDDPRAGARSRLTVVPAGPGAAGLGAPPPDARRSRAADALLQCTRRRILLTGARRAGRDRMLLRGAAGGAAAGRRVLVRRVGAKAVVARAVVGTDGTFVARLRAPRHAAGARYVATLGRAASAPLPLRPRFAATAVRLANGRVTFRGRVTRPFAATRRVTVAVRTGCSGGRARWRTVRTVRRSPSGAVVARFAAPRGLDVVLVRAATRVRSGRRTVAATTLPQAVAR
ncbi:hypothetical protein [Patulibacter sp. SYSU D01012]|uniref:hypothetical protein n=1 Tax=Patulibacter sp. SYSU D01012 TaxID=2817381 RepID=UPI001B3137A7|nr:hypothetical protein [Patulibacter sp. SYSU D01012]